MGAGKWPRGLGSFGIAGPKQGPYNGPQFCFGSWQKVGPKNDQKRTPGTNCLI